MNRNFALSLVAATADSARRRGANVDRAYVLSAASALLRTNDVPPQLAFALHARLRDSFHASTPAGTESRTVPGGARERVVHQTSAIDYVETSAATDIRETAATGLNALMQAIRGRVDFSQREGTWCVEDPSETFGSKLIPVSTAYSLALHLAKSLEGAEGRPEHLARAEHAGLFEGSALATQVSEALAHYVHEYLLDLAAEEQTASKGGAAEDAGEYPNFEDPTVQFRQTVIRRAVAETVALGFELETAWKVTGTTIEQYAQSLGHANAGELAASAERDADATVAGLVRAQRSGTLEMSDGLTEHENLMAHVDATLLNARALGVAESTLARIRASVPAPLY